MSNLVYVGLANAACAAVLAVLALAAGRFSRRPALAHALWLLVLIKLVTPPFLRLPVAWLPGDPPGEAAPAPAAARPAPPAAEAPKAPVARFVALNSPEPAEGPGPGSDGAEA